VKNLLYISGEEMMGFETEEWNYSEYFTPSLAKATHRLIERGEGPYLITTSGEKYIDFVQGIAVNALGHAHPALVEAACNQVKKLVHGSFNLINYPSALQLAMKLREVTPPRLDMFFFTNTGAESVETGLKLARYTTRKHGIIAFRGGFHGRTMGAASVTSSNVNFRKYYSPFLPQVYFAPYPYCFRCSFGQKVETCNLQCLDYLKEDFHYSIPPEDVSAVLFEPVMGEGGYVVPPAKYVKALRKMCDELGFLLIFDEVQTGLGRTGKLFASEVYNVIPDILCMGKAVGGGFPLGIVASTKERMSRWETGTHGTTFGGNPVACATALVQLEIITQDGFLQAVSRKGERFRSGLLELKKRFSEIGDVRGTGLMNAIELVKDEKTPNSERADNIRKFLFEKKILVLTCGAYKNVIRFVPPLNIDNALLDHVLSILEEALHQKP
jgi:4-aminobutyrate aminotransferase